MNLRLIAKPMVPRDDSYYHRLELRRDASHGDIVRAYRRMAMGAHPDAQPEDPEAAGRFREIAEAHQVLGDPVRRAAYDRQRMGAAGAHRRDGTPGPRAPMVRHVGEPIVLGTASHPVNDGVSLHVGPVRIEGEAGRPQRSDRWTEDDGGFWDRLVRSWWGP